MAAEFSLQIAEFVKKAGKNTEKFYQEFNQDLALEVQKATPVKTGNLRGSWSTKLNSPDTSPANGRNSASVSLILSGAKITDTVYHTNNSKYGVFVEFGTSRMSPRAFVRRTIARAAAIAQETLNRINK